MRPSSLYIFVGSSFSEDDGLNNQRRERGEGLQVLGITAEKRIYLIGMHENCIKQVGYEEKERVQTHIFVLHYHRRKSIQRRYDHSVMSSERMFFVLLLN